MERLTGLLSRYVAGEAGFVSRPFPQYANQYSDYDHLARVGEWSMNSFEGLEDGS